MSRFNIPADYENNQHQKFHLSVFYYNKLKKLFKLFLFYKIINFIFCANILFLNDNDIQKQALN